MKTRLHAVESFTIAAMKIIAISFRNVFIVGRANFKSLVLLSAVFISACSTPSTWQDANDGQSLIQQIAFASALSQPHSQNNKNESLISLIAVGDIMLGTDFPTDRLPEEEGANLLAAVLTELSDADITFGNFEGTFLSGGEAAKKCKDMSRCYVFRTPPGYVQLLVDAGFDVVSLANNHARDFGENGRDSTQSTFDNVNIHHSGKQGDIASWTVKGKKIALIAFAPFRGAYDPLDLVAASEIVLGLKTEHDIVIVSMHMGAEGEAALRIPFSDEIFYGERRGNVVAFSHAMIDAGADLVLGHGPHVPRALELYQGRLIAYSLGNFCTYYGINVAGLNGLAPILKVQLQTDGQFISGQIISARQQRPSGPILDSTHEAAKLMAELTNLDFPDTGLEIDEQGRITLRIETYPASDVMSDEISLDVDKEVNLDDETGLGSNESMDNWDK